MTVAFFIKAMASVIAVCFFLATESDDVLGLKTALAFLVIVLVGIWVRM